MNSRCILACAIVVLLVAPGVAADWPGSGALPGKNGLLDVEGPKFLDLALHRELHSHPAEDMLVLDGAIFVARSEPNRGSTYCVDDDTCTPTVNHTLYIERVDLSSGDISTVYSAASCAMQLLMDDFALITCWEYDTLTILEKFNLRTNQIEWSVDMTQSQVFTSRPHIFEPALQDGVIFLPVSPVVTTRAVIQLTALDVDTGEVIRVWDIDPPRFVEGPAGQQPIALVEGEPRVSASEGQIVISVAWTNDGTIAEGAGDSQDVEMHSAVLSVYGRQLDGDRHWEKHSPLLLVSDPTVQSATELAQRIGIGAWSIVDGRAVGRLDKLYVVNAASGATYWENDLVGVGDKFPGLGTSSIAIGGNYVYASTMESRYKLNLFTGATLWNTTTLDSDANFNALPMVLADGVGYAHINLVRNERMGSAIEAFDLETGQRLFYHETMTDALDNGRWFGGFGVDQGFIVYTNPGKTVSVFGEIPGSPGLPAMPEKFELYSDEPLSLQLAGGKPGIHGPATSFAVDWGDGDLIPWTPYSDWSHEYEIGQYNLTIQIANAEQSLTQVIPVNVTKRPELTTPPGPEPEATALATAINFARGNQDFTFGVLGIVVTAVGGAIGVWGVRRKRRRMLQFIQALGNLDDKFRTDSDRWMHGLHGWRRDVEAAMVAGKLTESQASALQTKGTELDRRHRLNDLEQHFGFLPMEEYRVMQHMLRDGRVTALEKEAVQAMVASSTTLSPAQVEKVERKLKQWFNQDLGASIHDAAAN